MPEKDQESKRRHNRCLNRRRWQRKRRKVFLFCFGKLARGTRVPTIADLRTEIDELSIHPILQTRMLDQTRAR